MFNTFLKIFKEDNLDSLKLGKRLLSNYMIPTGLDVTSGTLVDKSTVAADACSHYHLS